MAPVFFNLKNSTTPGASTSEVENEIRAEFDFLHHYAQKMATTLRCKNVHTLILKEEQTLLAFQLMENQEVRGYQSPRPYPWQDALDLL